MIHQNLVTLEQEIDKIRFAMYEMSKKVKCLTDPILVELSQQLDQKLNELSRCA